MSENLKNLKNLKELKKHIEEFPSKFDNTSIAQQLVEAEVSTRIYADVRHMWDNTILAREDLARIRLKVRDVIDDLNEELSFDTRSFGN